MLANSSKYFELCVKLQRKSLLYWTLLNYSRRMPSNMKYTYFPNVSFGANQLINFTNTTMHREGMQMHFLSEGHIIKLLFVCGCTKKTY
jgi:hypothetical protein